MNTSKLAQPIATSYDSELEIIFRDDYLIAINKPAGLLVHKSPIDRHETRFALQLLRDQIGQWVYPLHRLDKPTSGVLLYALDQDTARHMSACFEAGKISKHYLAVVRGFAPQILRIDHAIRERHDPAAGPRSRPPVAQEAVTKIRRLSSIEWPDAVDRYPSARYSMVLVTPLTGRRHQIRRHLKHISHPLIGDTTYGKSSHNQYFAKRFDCHRLLLHACELGFDHPNTGDFQQIKASLDPVFARVSAAFGQ